MLTLTLNHITLSFFLTLLIVAIAAIFTLAAVRSYLRTRDLINAILLGLTSMVLVSELWALLHLSAQLGELADFLAWLEPLRWLRLTDRLYKTTVLLLIIYGFKIIRENHTNGQNHH